MMTRFSILRLPGWLFTLSALAACSESTLSPVGEPNFNVSPFGATASLCKRGPEGTWARFRISATGGDLPQGTEVTIPALETCQPGVNVVLIWRSNTADNVVVTVTEIASSPGLVVDLIRTIGLEGTVFWPPEGLTGTTTLNNLTNGAFLFKNVQIERGTEGCTPGYWKQKQHFDSWVGYAPGTLFGSVFANAFPGKTLLQVLSQGGGGPNALGRHAVAALLNAAADVDYQYTTAQVIAAFNAAFASGEYEALKNIFEGENELGCPLD